MSTDTRCTTGETTCLVTLEGFERVTLNPGETKTVTFQLGPCELGYWSTNLGKWVQDAEAFDIWVGSDSLATLHADLVVVR